MRNLIAIGALVATVIVTTAASAAVVPPRKPQPRPNAGPVVCSDGMGYLSDVTRFDIEGIGDDRVVMIEPVCADDHLSGNVVGLRTTIGNNETLATALEEANAGAEDVVGIRFGQGLVLLYVAQ